MTPDWIPYGRQSIDDDDIAAVASVLKGDWLTTGPAVEEFEQALVEIAGAQTVVLSSGTAALHAAYAAIGLGPKDEVIVPAITFVATAAAAVHLGATVRFVDVRDDTLNVDLDAMREEISPRTKAIVAVDYAGHPAEMDELNDIARATGTILISDASHSLGATYHRKPVGSLADMTTFSFHPVKIITTGEGGAVAALKPDHVESVRRFRNHGLVRDPAEHRIAGQGDWHQEVHEVGLNYRLPDPLAALGRSQLKRLDSFIDRRRLLADRYSEALADVEGIRLPVVLEGVEPAWHLYPIRVQDGRRPEIFDHMRSNGIGVQVHYLPVHMHPAFDKTDTTGSLPVAERAYEELLSLPLYPGMADSEQDRVVEVLASKFNQ